MKALLLILLALVIFALHQDVWFWTEYKPLVFGFIPVGLAYHGAFSILCSIMMIFFVKFAWPEHLEEVAQHPPKPGDEPKP